MADLAAPAAAAAFFPIATQPARENARPCLGGAHAGSGSSRGGVYRDACPVCARSATAGSARDRETRRRCGSASAEGTAQFLRRLSSDLIDLNSASLEQLNGLRGGGMIGRAIVRAALHIARDLLRKRVLNRSTFDRVRDQMIVR